jgi:DNA polymerase-4
VLLGVELYHLANEVFQRIKEENFHGKTVTLKIKYEDFRSVSRSKTLQHYISDRMELVQVGKRLLENIDLSKKKVRLIGIGVSNSVNDIDLPNKQLMFDFY